MPYNNSAILPPDEITGTSCLPLTRIKRIIATDEDIVQCSNGAAFAISIATETFIRYLTEQAHNVVKAERKPRRYIQYKDLANAVARIDNLDFLADVIPKTTTYRQFKEKRRREEASTAAVATEAEAAESDAEADDTTNNHTTVNAGTPLPPGQTTLSNGFESMRVIGRHRESIADSTRTKGNGSMTAEEESSQPVNGSPIALRTVHSSPHGDVAQGTEEDVEMEDDVGV